MNAWFENDFDLREKENTEKEKTFVE